MLRKINLNFLDENGKQIASGLDYYVPNLGEAVKFDNGSKIFRVRKRHWSLDSGTFTSVEIICEPWVLDANSYHIPAE
jgi:hypothetical protein